MNENVRFLLFQGPQSTTSLHETTKAGLQVHFTDSYDEDGQFFIFYPVTTTVSPMIQSARGRPFRWLVGGMETLFLIRDDLLSSVLASVHGGKPDGLACPPPPFFLAHLVDKSVTLVDVTSVSLR